MSFLTRLTRRSRHLSHTRRSLRVLERIATALERQNQLMEELHPEVVRRLATPPVVESGVTYVNPEVVAQAEQLREELFQQTGQRLDDDQLYTYMVTAGMVPS
jgi:hypothetical protein